MQRCSAYNTKTIWRWEHANKVPPWKKTFRRTSIIIVGGLGYGSGFCGDSNIHACLPGMQWTLKWFCTHDLQSFTYKEISSHFADTVWDRQCPNICILGWRVIGAASDNAVDISAAEDRNHSCTTLHVHADGSSTIVRGDFYLKRINIFKFFGCIPLL